MYVRINIICVYVDIFYLSVTYNINTDVVCLIITIQLREYVRTNNIITKYT